MTTSLVLDTHSAVWYWSRSPRLSAPAASAIRPAKEAGHPLFICSVSIVELIYLVEKGRIEASKLPEFLSTLRRPDSDVIVKPFDLDMAEALSRVPRDIVADMPDRMIAATALHLKLPLVTVDAQIRASDIETIW